MSSNVRANGAAAGALVKRTCRSQSLDDTHKRLIGQASTLYNTQVVQLQKFVRKGCEFLISGTAPNRSARVRVVVLNYEGDNCITVIVNFQELTL